MTEPRVESTGDAESPRFDDLSTYELLRTLQLAGFRFVGTMRRHAMMETTNDVRRVVFVPIADALTHGQVVGLLETGGVTLERFARLRERLTSRDTWQEPLFAVSAPESFPDSEAPTQVGPRSMRETDKAG